MNYILTFKELSKNDTHVAGGKGASLGEMTKAGIPVPPGFVIHAPAFDHFLTQTDLLQEIESQLDRVNYDDVASITHTSETIADLIHDARFPEDIAEELMAAFKDLDAEYVAVRSSATAEDSSVASWAGELESYLNTTEKNLIGNVKKCWASLFTPRAIVYRNEKGMRSTHVSVGVVVQKMVQSEISGITFTVHPVTEDRNQMIIEACWGLGEYIVGGVVTPDSYVVDKKKGTLIDINVSEQEWMLARKGSENKKMKVDDDKREKQKLSNDKIEEIAGICKKIEEHYKFPCDIEWAYEDGKFYIVQSRPITTL